MSNVRFLPITFAAGTQLFTCGAGSSPDNGLLVDVTEPGAQPGHRQAVSDGSIFISTVSHEATHMSGMSGGVILRVDAGGEVSDEIDGLAGIQLIGNRLIFDSQSFVTRNRDLWALYGSEVDDEGRTLPFAALPH